MKSRHSPPEYNWRKGVFFPNILGMLNDSMPKSEYSGSTARRLEIAQLRLFKGGFFFISEMLSGELFYL